MYKIYLLLLFIACCNCAAANKKVMIGNITFKNAALDPDPAPFADFKTLVVPIKRAGNLIIVEATVDTLEGNFVLDTGAPYLVLNETYFRDSPKIEDEDAEGINGQSTGAFKTYVRNFKILDLQYSRLTADVTDLSSIENSRHIKVLGLLGTRLFSKFAITVDLFRNVLYIQKLDNNGEIPETERVYHDRFMVCPFKLTGDVIFMKGSVNNTSLWFAFDSAAETNLLDYKLSKKIIENMEVVSRSKVTGIGGSSFEVIYARFDELRIGDRSFMKNHVLLTDLSKMSNAYGASVDGVLGYDFFSRGIFTINFVKKEFEMYIYTNQ
jgi:hypothetical protein